MNHSTKISLLIRLILFIASVLYEPMHGFHIAGAPREIPVDPTQVQLPVFTFFVSLPAVVSGKWRRQDTPVHHT